MTEAKIVNTLEQYRHITDGRNAFWVKFTRHHRGGPVSEYHLFEKDPENYGDDWVSWAVEVCEEMCQDWHNASYKVIDYEPVAELPEDVRDRKRIGTRNKIKELEFHLQQIDGVR